MLTVFQGFIINNLVLNFYPQYYDEGFIGAAQPHVYPKDIESLKIIIPNEEILHKYGEIVYSMNEKITNNLKQNQELSALRDWLLPMLMNGQVKVG